MVRIKNIEQGPPSNSTDPCNSHRVRQLFEKLPIRGIGQGTGHGGDESDTTRKLLRYAPRMLLPWLTTANLRFSTAVSLLLSMLCR